MIDLRNLTRSQLTEFVNVLLDGGLEMPANT